MGKLFNTKAFDLMWFSSIFRHGGFLIMHEDAQTTAVQKFEPWGHIVERREYSIRVPNRDMWNWVLLVSAVLYLQTGFSENHDLSQTFFEKTAIFRKIRLFRGPA
jgi:hypothetical protein